MPGAAVAKPAVPSNPLDFLESATTTTPSNSTRPATSVSISPKPKATGKKFKWSDIPMRTRIAFGVVGAMILFVAINSGHGPVGGGSGGVMTREHFQQAVIGKTPQQVIQAVGRPDSTALGDTQWMYYDKTKNPTTGQNDEGTFIRFNSGVAVSVEFGL